MVRTFSHRMACVAICTIAVSASATTASAMTAEDVSRGFRDGVGVCITAGLQGKSIGQLGEADRKGLSPGGESVRSMLNLSGPVWDVPAAKGIVVVWEPKSGDCEVMGYGPPVDLTFKAAVADAKKLAPKLVDVAIEPGYDPIVYRLNEVENGAVRLDVMLHGAEPGTPGHTFRFSMLKALVTWPSTSP